MRAAFGLLVTLVVVGTMAVPVRAGSAARGPAIGAGMTSTTTADASATPTAPSPATTPPATTPPATTPPATTGVTDDDGRTTAELVTLARQQYEALEYDRVAELTTLALGRTDLALADKLVAYALQGSALAITADPVDAEKPFRLLLRAEPQFVLPDATPPKILAVFRKVEAEERAIRAEFVAIERERLVATLKLEAVAPRRVRGGRTLRFEYRLRDSQGAVETVRVQYRRRGEAEFTSLPLARGDAGIWAGQIPGEWTASDIDFVLEYFVVAADDVGPLLMAGNSAAPQSLAVPAGQVDLFGDPVPQWGFWLTVAATGAAGIVASGLAAATVWQDQQILALVARATAAEPIDGAALRTVRTQGENLMVAQFIGWGITAVGAVASGALVPFTQWEDDDEDGAVDAGSVDADTAAGGAP